jgi:hypothetical protein
MSFRSLLAMAKPLVVALGAIPTFGTLGDSIESAKKTDFFRWFSLVRVGSARDALGREVIEFQPEGEKFRKFVSFKLTCDSAGQLLAAELTLDREFINSPENGIFAADIAKSFLLDAIPKRDLPKVKTLAAEIQIGSYRSSGKPVILRADTTPQLPKDASPGYHTYRDLRQQWQLPLKGMQLSLENKNVNGRRVLVMNLS